MHRAADQVFERRVHHAMLFDACLARKLRRLDDRFEMVMTGEGADADLSSGERRLDTLSNFVDRDHVTKLLSTV